MSIEISSVTKRFGSFVALDDVSVSIPAGQLTALLGPSGGGKSTLLRIIAGLEHADDGRVEIEGVDTTYLPARKRNVGFVFQHYAAFRHLTVRRNIAFGLEIRKRPKAEVRERVDQLLELVHLQQFADRQPAQLSGGQRQRMALARALAVEPKVLLLDEPTAGLTEEMATRLLDEQLGELKASGIAVLLVEQRANLAMASADWAYVLASGRVRRSGSAAELRADPSFSHIFLGGTEENFVDADENTETEGEVRCS